MDQENTGNIWPAEYCFPQYYWPSIPFSHPMQVYYPPRFYPNFPLSNPTITSAPEPKKTETQPPIESPPKVVEGKKKDPEVKKEEIAVKNEVRTCHCSQSKCLKEYCLCYKNGMACG